MASGRAVVVSDVGDVTQLVRHGLDGFVCPVNSRSDFLEALQQLFREPQKLNEMGRNARLRAEELCSINRMVDAMMNCYREVLA